MSAFFIRSATVLALFLLSSFLESLIGRPFLAVSIWFIAVSTWTLFLGFRKALWILIPFLVIADVLWDGTVGPVFLSGFLLATATTYIAVRIEDRSAILQIVIACFLISVCAALAVITPSFWYQNTLRFLEMKMIGGIFLWILVITILFFIPVRKIIKQIERWLDTSKQEQMRKIR